MTEYDNEPIPGLPGIPPAGERILWQGAPEWRTLARTAFHTRLVTGYFVALTGWATATALVRGVHAPADLAGVALTALFGIVGVALLNLLAWGSARTTLYTLTNKRIVLRVGMALPKCINLPLALVGSVDLALRADGTGDMPISLTGDRKLGFVALWPHARPWRVATPQPMLRAIPGAADVAALIARTCLAVNPQSRMTVPSATVTAVPAFGEAVAA